MTSKDRFIEWYGSEQPCAELGEPVSFERQSWDYSFAAWSARDAEVDALKERVAELEGLVKVGLMFCDCYINRTNPINGIEDAGDYIIRAAKALGE